MQQELSTFLKMPENCDFTMYNIPFGVVQVDDGDKFPATIIGDTVINLQSIEQHRLFKGPLFALKPTAVFIDSLNDFIKLTRAHWKEARETIQSLFSSGSQLENDQEMLNTITVHVSKVKYHLPCTVGEYTDYYSSKNHAFNMGSLLRGPGNELQPNWLYLPGAYHGRRSTIVVTGEDVVRPWGQTKAPTSEVPTFGITKRLDFELEVGAVLGGPCNRIGEPIKVVQAEQCLFGLVLLNDWSARDIQGWEYVPLGPFTAKNFMTTISPWIVTIEALSPYRVQLAEQIPPPLLYLVEQHHTSFDIDLQVHIGTKKNPQLEHVITSNFKHLYWSISQQIAHHSVSGCMMLAGDILGSGTISGETKESRGCMMEYTWNGKEPMTLKSGETRNFLEDGDIVEFKAYSGQGNRRVGFGSCSGKVTPALPQEYFQQ